MAATEIGQGQDDTLYATILPTPSGGETPDPSQGALTPSAFGRYVLLRAHARGGLGEVYLARDVEFGREVAVKQIQGRHADDPVSRGRFVREAEITGNLEHPGVVPVYGFGRSPDGRLYYAMRFIRGESLEAALARFHGAEGPDRDPGERSVERIRLLKRFNDACDAIEYAHSRGILHRDLKPSNIMLGPHGETLVVDWGLAKSMSHPEADSDAEAEADIDLPLDAIVPATASDQTLPGSPLGTPAFMSPEQAAGRVDALRPASDVYNLGATLYCLLAGRPPFQTAPLGELLAKIQRGDFPPPRSVARSPVPPALEAVCLKAMAREPADRYPTARALADDVLRWVADEPVSAYRESGGERLRRWSRRHRSWVRGGAALVVALLLVMTAATWAVNLAWQSEQETRLRAEGFASSLLLDQGLNLCERGEPGSGMLRLCHALATAPDRSDGLRRTILANLSAWQSASGRLRTILPHTDEVLAAAFGPDGRVVVTGGPAGASPTRGEARLWDAQAARPLGPPLPHPAPVTSAAFRPDGKALLTGSADGSARLWDPASGRPLGPPLAHPAPVQAVAFSPDGKTLLTSGGHAARLWDAATLRPLPSPADQPAEVTGAAFSPDGRLLLTGGQDSTVRLWDVADGRPASPPLPHDDPVNCVAFAPDGKTFAAGGAHGNVRFWDLATLQRSLHRLLHRSEVVSLAYRPDGRAVMTGSGDNTAVLWDPANGLPLGPPLEHRGTVWAVAFSPDGRTALTASSDNAARLWDPPPGRPLRASVPEPGRVLALATRPDGRQFAVSCADGTTSVRDAATLAPLGPPIRHPGRVRALAYSPDGATLVSGGSDGTARLWDAATRRPLRTLAGHRGAVTVAEFSPDGRTVLTGGDDATVRLWNASDGRPLAPPWPQPAAVSDAAFSPDGRKALIACGNSAGFWDVANGRALGVTFGHQGPVHGVAFAPDGKLAATAGEDNTVRLWDAETGRPVSSVLEHQATVRALAFSPDGQTLLTGGNDQCARLWGVATGRAIGPPLRHIGAVTAVAFAPDGRSVLTGGSAGTRLWDAPAPLRDDVESIRLSVRVATGLTLDTGSSPSGTVARLAAPDWQTLRLRLDAPGAPVPR